MAITRTTLKEKLFVKNEYNYEHQNPAAVLTQEEQEYAKSLWGINLNLHKTCVNCQVRHMLKYESHLDPETQQKTKTFTVPCDGIPKHMPPGSSRTMNEMIEKGMDPKRAALLLQSTQDPVAWAELMFGFDDSTPTWHLRPYQKEQLRCTSRQLVIREGRRAGKSFSIALKLLYYIFNKVVDRGRDGEGKSITGGPLIMVVTPYQVQLTGLFNEMEKLLKRNKDLQAEVQSGSADSLYVKTPSYHMDFKNGGMISGFVSGVGIKSDGSGGGTLRGSSAHIIYLDEMDMIPDETIEKVIMPILASDLEGRPIFIATSTPIGKRGKFYNMCLNDPAFKEDYLPSTVIPQWKNVKAILTKDLSSEAIQTELMAAFVDGSFGVFKPSYVYRARKDYEYEELFGLTWWKKTFGITEQNALIRCIGIDWNKNAGTEFCVVTYVPGSIKYIVTETVNIPHAEFSAVRWQEELIRLNYKWKPDYIYADEGYGQTIIENLKLISFSMLQKGAKTLQDVETSKLGERLRSYNFSGKVVLNNPIDNTPFEKMGKDFLIETAKRIFEDSSNIVWFPESEIQLKNELLNYVELRRNPQTGRVVYGPQSDRIGDHRLDAFMLALTGIQIEAGLYSNSNIANSIPVFIPKDVLDARDPSDNFIEMRKKNPLLQAVDLLKIQRPGDTPAMSESRGTRGYTVPRRKGSIEKPGLIEHFEKKLPKGIREGERLPNSDEPHIISRRNLPIRRR